MGLWNGKCFHAINNNYPAAISSLFQHRLQRDAQFKMTRTAEAESRMLKKDFR